MTSMKRTETAFITSFLITNYCNHRANKKVLAVQSCNQAALWACRVSCMNSLVYLNSLLIAYTHPHSLIHSHCYLLFLTLPPPPPSSRASELKSDSLYMASLSSTAGRPGIQRKLNTSIRPSGYPSPAWGRPDPLFPSGSERRCWRPHVSHPGLRRMPKSPASRCAWGSPVTSTQIICIVKRDLLQ